MTSIIKKDNNFSIPISMYMHDQWVNVPLRRYGMYVVIYGQISSGNIGNNYIGILTAPDDSSKSAVVTDITPNRSDVGLEYNWNNGFSIAIHVKSTSYGMLRVIEIF